MVRMIGFYLLVFTILLGHPITYALPAKDVKLVLDREYFQVTRELLRSAKKSIQVMMFEASFYAKHPKSPSNILNRRIDICPEKGDRRGGNIGDERSRG